jgi:hypothetical protein
MAAKKYHTEKERKEANRKRLREWVKNNPERAASHWRKYRENNQEKMNSRRREDRKFNPEKYSEYTTKYRQSTVKRFISKKFSGIRTRRFKKKGIKKVIDITVDFLVDLYEKQEGRCAITKHKMTTKFKCLYCISIDRIDSSKGYTKDNVQLVCQAMNFCKNAFTNEEILRFWNERSD